MKKFFHKETQIVSKEKIASETFLLKLQEPQIADISEPGQFLHIKINGKSLRRPISIFSKNDGYIEIVFRVRGEGTRALSSTGQGEHIDVLGPLGNPFPLEGEKPLFVAGGIGAAPLNFLACAMKSKGTFLYGVANETEFIPMNHLQSMGHKLIKVSEEKNKQRVTDLLPSFINDADIIYAAGPEQMLKISAQICLKSGKKGYVSWEERMGCGIGMCQACAVKTKEGYKKTCTEGPVFDFKEIAWDEY